jgi:hypothetical protein
VTRIRWALPLVAVLALLAAWPASAHHKPGHGGGATTTTTVAPTTTTVAPTTTTVAPTTTTVAPTTTTVGGCSPGTPITITTGGTYSGCYQSTSAGTPAVRVSTTAPVTLDHAQIKAKGDGIQYAIDGINLTVRDSTFTQTDPGADVTHRAINVFAPASLVVENNLFSDGDGILVASPVGGPPGLPNPLRVYANRFINVGRYQHTTTETCCVQTLQLDHVSSPAIEVGWNWSTNQPGQSGIEDNVNFFVSGGTDSTHRADVHHNLYDGAYPWDTTRGDFSGGGILVADSGGGHASVHDNTVVSTTNYGVACVSGTDCHLGPNNLLVNDAIPSTIGGPETSGPAIQIHSTTGSDATGNSYNWVNTPGGAQYPCYQTSYCSGNTQVATTEQQARDSWAAARQAAGVTVGPRP